MVGSVDVDRRLKRFYGHLLVRERNVNAFTADDWRIAGMSEEEGRALLSQPDFPWAEVAAALRRDEADGRLAEEIGHSEEYVKDLRTRLYDPEGKPYS